MIHLWKLYKVFKVEILYGRLVIILLSAWKSSRLMFAAVVDASTQLLTRNEWENIAIMIVEMNVNRGSSYNYIIYTVIGVLMQSASLCCKLFYTSTEITDGNQQQRGRIVLVIVGWAIMS